MIIYDKFASGSWEVADSHAFDVKDDLKLVLIIIIRHNQF